MEANTRKLERIFDQTITYQVPLFQRPYVWTQDENWEPLWDDIQALLERHFRGVKVHPHFLGAVVLEQVGNATGSIESRQVIDGQQRFTTLQLFLMAARDLASHYNASKYVERFTDLVANRRSKIDRDDEVFKVWPTNSNRAAFRLVHEAGSPETLKLALQRRPEVDERSNNIIGAYRYFHGRLAAWFDGKLDDDADAPVLSKKSIDDRFDSLWHVVKDCLQVVVIDLDKEDETQVIFETLNARGEDLLPADLIKNFLFRRAASEGENVEKLYDNHWREFETSWWREQVKQGRTFRPRVDVFISHYLTMMTREEIKTAHLFNAYKAFVDHFESPPSSLLAVPQTTAEHIAQLSRYAAVFKTFDEKRNHARLEIFLSRLGAIDTTTVFPFLLYAYGELVPHARAEFDKILVLIESYLMRRMICNLTGKHYNRYFVDLLRNVDQNGVLDAASVADYMARSSAESVRYPDDQSLAMAVTDLPLYNRLAQAKVRAVLEALDAHAHTSKSEMQPLPPKLTIEHVMPQAWTEHWPLSSTELVNPETQAIDPIRQQKAEQRRARLIDTLGNLTLVTASLNPSMQNAAWSKKRPELTKFSKLNLNQYFHGPDADSWDEAAIERRTSYLCGQLMQIWPTLPQVEKDSQGAHPAAATAPASQQACQMAAPARTTSPAAQHQADELTGLARYTGEPPNAFAHKVIQALRAEGFTVATTTQGPNKERKTLRIGWRGEFIGLMSEGLWGRRVPVACLYRFPKDGGKSTVAAAPAGFDKTDFARQHGCDPDLLHVNTDYSGSYLWVLDQATTLHLMRDSARKVDALHGV